MTSKQSIKKCVSAPFTKLLPPIMKQKNIPEFINIYRGAQMIPYSFDGITACLGIGVLHLVRNTGDKRLELNFLTNMDNEPSWKCTLDQFDQLKRPRPNLLCVESYGITTLFKFSDAQEAKSLYDAVDLLQSTAKVISKSDIGPPTNFQELDLKTWNQMRALKEARQNAVRARPYPELKSKSSNITKAKENVKPKVIKQRSIKNSFKTIISAAKRVKDTKVQEKPKFVKKPSKDDDDTSPLLL